MSKVNVETGEVVKVHTWRDVPEVKALDCGKDKSFIQHQDFAYDDETRGLKIVDTEVEDRDAYIQSFAEEAGVYNILKKYSRTGDASLLNVKQGFYGDVASLPSDNLDPEAAKVAAAKALGGLNKSLGTDLSAEELAKLSSEELDALIQKAVQAAASKAVEKKEGVENA